MPPTSSFSEFLARLEAGNDESARELFSRFTHRLIALARTHLDMRIRQKVDPEDVLQSVYRSFFRRHAAGEFELHGWDGLWSLLAAITVHKCRRWNRHFHTAKRDVGHETHLGDQGEESGKSQESLAREPTPHEVFQLTELVENLHKNLPPENRPILSLILQGRSIPEISEQAKCSQRSVYRVLGKVKDTLQRLSAEDAAEA